jgi:hypothetical protein
MSVAPIENHEIAPASPASPTREGWKRRLEDPLRRLYREPLAQLVAARLSRTRVTSDQLMVVGPLLAGVAGYVVSFAGPLPVAAAGLAFELRTIAGHTTAALARARGEAASRVRPAAEWLGAALLYVGIFCHVHLNPPPAGPWSAYLSTNGVLVLALLQAALRGFAGEYYTAKVGSIFERGRDESVEALRRSPMTRVIAGLWAVSNGEAFLSIVVLTMLVDALWLGQVLFATVGMVWIVGVVLLSRWFLRGATRRGKLVVA